MLKKIVFLLLFAIPAHAEFYFAPGGVIGFGDYSEELGSDDRPLIDLNAGGGVHLDSEMSLILGFSFNLGLQYYIMNSTVDYNYTNPDNSSDTGQMNGLNTGITTFALMPGVRFYILNGAKFKMYVGAGTYSAAATYSHNKEDYEDETGSVVGFTEGATSSLSGSYSEVGFKYFWSKKNGLQLGLKKIQFKSSEVETMDKKEFSSNMHQMLVLYNHMVDWSFFWK